MKEYNMINNIGLNVIGRYLLPGDQAVRTHINEGLKTDSRGSLYPGI